MTPPRNELTQIRLLRSQGISLDDEQKEKLRAYYRKYDTNQVCIYLRGQREAEWKAMAQAKGDRFSTWIQDRVAEALAGPGPRLGELTRENDALRDELRALRGVNGKIALENERLGNRIEGLESDLTEALGKLLAYLGGTA